MKYFATLLIVIVSFTAFSQGKGKPKTQLFSTLNRKITVYTSADSTNLRLSQTDNLTFKELKQPLETQICVFVNPTKTYQTFLGIGGAADGDARCSGTGRCRQMIDPPVDASRCVRPTS